MAIFDSLDETTDHAISRSEAFIRNSEAYYELKLFQMLSSSLTLFIKFSMISALVLIAVIFMAMAISTSIGNALNSAILGYLCTAGIFIILSIIIYLLRKTIENIIIKKLSTKIYKK